MKYFSRMNWSFDRKLGVLLALIVAGTSGATAIAWRNSAQFRQAAQTADRTRDEIVALEEALQLMTDVQAATLGFVITGQEPFLDRYRNARAAVESELQLFERLNADHPVQIERLAALRGLVARDLDWRAGLVNTTRIKGVEAGRQLVINGEGKVTMDALRALADQMVAEEERTLRQRRETGARFGRRVRATLAGLATLIAGLAVTSFLLVRHQIASRSQVENALRRNEESLSTTLHSIGHGLIATDLSGRVTRMNPVAERMTGWTHSEASGQSIGDVFRVISEETRTPAVVAVESVLRTGETHGLADHTVLIARDGTERYVADSAAPIREADGHMTGVVLVFRDVTEARRAEEALKRSASEIRQLNEQLENRVRERTAQLGAVVQDLQASVTEDQRTHAALRRAEQEERHSRELLDQAGRVAHVGGWELDVETQTLRWSDETYRIHELDPSVKPTVAEAIHFYAPEARPAITAAVQAALDAGTPFDLELPFVTAQGRRLWVRAQGSAHRRGDKIIRLYGAFQDITEDRRRSDSLRLRRAALEAVSNAIMITDIAGVVEWVNPAFSQLTGYTLEEALGKNPRDLMESGKQARAFYAQFWDTILAGRTWDGEMINRRKDGSLYTERQTVTPIRDASGALMRFVAIKEDITERLKLEAQYRQAQRMEVVGQLASGVAHDFNNLLTVINGMSELVLEQVGQDDPVHSDIEEIHRAGERGAALTRQLLAFSRQQALAPQVLNLNDALIAMESLLRRLLGEDIDLNVVTAPDLGQVKADPGQLEQVITNLAVNARDAMPRGGTLTIETQNVTMDEDNQDGTVIPAGAYVMLTVSDSGTGMDEVTRTRIFEPFFTTKDPGKGTGLGLSTVYGIVRQSHGLIFVDSEVGQGTRFKIYLPQVTATADVDKLERIVGSTAGTETILVAEDDPAVRNLTTRILQPAGYTVLEAAGGEEALNLLAHHTGSIHLLLSDVVMPGMSGRQLAERVVQTHPHVKVLFMSGYKSDTIAMYGVLEAMSFLGKPFTRKTLLPKVREVLDS